MAARVIPAPTPGDRPPGRSRTLRGWIPGTRGRVHLVVGPVGAGKSTFAAALSRENTAVRLTLDDWFVTLFTPDRPDSGVVEWYRERSLRCIQQIWKMALEIVGSGTDAVLEVGLLRRREREQFYAQARLAGIPLRVFVVDAERAVRRERVLAHNRGGGETFSMVVPPDV